MNNKKLREKLCGNFCSYYKRSKKEEYACQGLVIVERLIGKGKNIPFERFGIGVNPVIIKKLSLALCTDCPFYLGGCDFAEKKEGALQCGGFILLEHLIDGETISFEDLAQAR